MGTLITIPDMEPFQGVILIMGIITMEELFIGSLLFCLFCYSLVEDTIITIIILININTINWFV